MYLVRLIVEDELGDSAVLHRDRLLCGDPQCMLHMGYQSGDIGG